MEGKYVYHPILKQTDFVCFVYVHFLSSLLHRLFNDHNYLRVENLLEYAFFIILFLPLFSKFM